MPVKNTPHHSKYHKPDTNNPCYHFLALFLKFQFTNAIIIKIMPIKDKVLNIINNEVKIYRFIIPQQILCSKKSDVINARTNKRIPIQSKIS